MAEHESKRRAFDQSVERTKFIAFGCAQHEPVGAAKFIAFGCAQREPVGLAHVEPDVAAFDFAECVADDQPERVADAAAFGTAHGVTVAVPDAGTDVPAKHFAKFAPKSLAVELSDDESDGIAKLAPVDAADHEPERVPIAASHLGPDELSHSRSSV